MSHGKEISYVEERLRAIDRDITVKLGTLAQAIKTDLTAIRVRLEALEQRMQQLERSLTPEKLNG